MLHVYFFIRKILALKDKKEKNIFAIFNLKKEDFFGSIFCFVSFATIAKNT
jgi:hypothetical protein